MKIGVLHQGAGNIHSVCRGFRALGHEPVILTSGTDIGNYERIVLPGVGSFATGMRVLRDQQMIPMIREYVTSGRPFLGICLGAQLIMESSREFGDHDGLGFIPGFVDWIPRSPDVRVPHVGWAQLKGVQSWSDTYLSDMSQGDYVYFTHSLVCHPQSQSDVIARVDYKSESLVAAVRKDNVTGVQFHPELSTERGLSILENFVRS